MRLEVVSKNIDASEALRERIAHRVEGAVEKYFPRSGDAHVAVQRDGPGFRVDITLHLDSGTLFRTSAEGHDAYGAAEAAMDRLEKRLRRYKRRRTDRRAGRGDGEAAHIVLASRGPDFSEAAETEDDAETTDRGDEAAVAGEDDGALSALIIAESTAEVPSLTVRSAVAEMDLTDAPVLVFRNAAHDGVNVVYRRADGHIGWIDPDRRTAGTNGRGSA